MKILFYGNCQTQVTMACLALSNPDVAFEYAGNSNRVALFDPERTLRLMDWCDHIVTQPVMNLSNPDHHDGLRARFAGKITFMPYIWIDGLFSMCLIPEIQPGSAKGAGFVGETHVTDHLQSVGFAQTLVDFQSGSIDFHHARRFETSMTELARREGFADVAVTPFVRHHYRDQQVMLTHNHPHPVLVNEIARQIAARLALNHRPVTPDDPAAYAAITLSEFGKILSPHGVRDLGLRLPYDLQWLRQGQKFIAQIADQMTGLADRTTPSDLHSQKAARQTLIDEKQAQSEALRQQSEVLREKSGALRAQSEALREQSEALRQQTAEVKAQNDALRAQIVERKLQNDLLRAQNAEKQALIAARQVQNDALQAQNARQQALKADLRRHETPAVRSPVPAPQPLPPSADHATKGHAGDLP